MTTETKNAAFVATEVSEEDKKTFATIDELFSCPGSTFIGSHWTNERRGKSVISYFEIHVIVNGVPISFRADRPYVPHRERTANPVPIPDR